MKILCVWSNKEDNDIGMCVDNSNKSLFEYVLDDSVALCDYIDEKSDDETYRDYYDDDGELRIDKIILEGGTISGFFNDLGVFDTYVGHLEHGGWFNTEEITVQHYGEYDENTFVDKYIVLPEPGMQYKIPFERLVAFISA